MSTLSLKIPPGFVVIQGDLCFLDEEGLVNASSAEIEARNQSEDLCAVEHVVLDVSIYLGADTELFSVSAIIGDRGHTVVERTAPTFSGALQCFEEVARDVWDLHVPWRDEYTTYDRPKATDARRQMQTWIIPAGWSILFDRLSKPLETPASSATIEPMEALFAAVASHRSIAIYKLNRAEQNAPYVGLLWAEPPGKLYERIFFTDANDVASWLRRRLRQDALPRRRKQQRS